MSAVVLIDTSVYLNILNVPDNNQDYEQVDTDFTDMENDGDQFLLPLATIFETGNHIADLDNGRQRRAFAQLLVDDVCNSLTNNAPYTITQIPPTPLFVKWLSEFPNYAMRNKQAKKAKEEGVSLSDFTIIKEWDVQCAKNPPPRRVRIWSLDSDLSAYDRK